MGRTIMEGDTRITEEELKHNKRISIEGIKEGNNEQWKLFYMLYYERMRNYAFKFTRSDSSVDDIVGNAIANTYANRSIFDDSVHLLSYTFTFLRFECLNWINRGPGRFFMDDNILVKIDWYLSNRREYFQTEDPQERTRMDELRDQMLERIKDMSRKLPRRWKQMVELYLRVDTMNDIYTLHKQNTGVKAGKELGVKAFSMIRQLIESSKNIRDRPQMLERYAQILRGLTKSQKAILKSVYLNKTRENVMDDMKIVDHTISNGLSSVKAKLKEVVNDPRLVGTEGNDKPGQLMDYFAGEHDDDINKLYQDIIVDPPPVVKEKPVKEKSVKEKREVYRRNAVPDWLRAAEIRKKYNMGVSIKDLSIDYNIRRKGILAIVNSK